MATKAKKSLAKPKTETKKLSKTGLAIMKHKGKPFAEVINQRAVNR